MGLFSSNKQIEGDDQKSRHAPSSHQHYQTSRFPPISRSASLPSTDFVQSQAPSPSNLQGPPRSEITPRLLDPATCREARPFLGRHSPKIFEKYKPLKPIGRGQYGTVFAVEERIPAKLPAVSGDKKDKPRVYACKIVDIVTPAGVDDDPLSLKTRLEDVMNEIEMMSSSTSGSHPNVQDLIDFAIEEDKAYIVSSLCRGGDLAQALEMRGCLCEEDARNVMSGMLDGLAHLHSRGVVHRDLKLENVLLTNSKHDMSQVKIIDMGYAKHLAPPGSSPCADAMNSVCGTPLYIAPELVRPSVQKGKLQRKARYGTQADMWSCGVIMYCLLSGYSPFDAAGRMSMWELFEDIQNAAYDFSDPVWQTVSGDALAMIEGLLEVDPAKRLTAEQALRHPWMVGC